MPFLEYLCAEFIDGIETSKLGAMYAVVDVDGDGSVSWPEFLWCVTCRPRLRLRWGLLLRPSRELEKTGGGYDSSTLSWGRGPLPLLNAPHHHHR